IFPKIYLALLVLAMSTRPHFKRKINQLRRCPTDESIAVVENIDAITRSEKIWEAVPVPITWVVSTAQFR
ncbi:MAG: hypothetical protein O3C60_17305, partial [Planctomycetota bacterium]|nr:hypothetical protein [Planctomycetota bacterium]